MYPRRRTNQVAIGVVIILLAGIGYLMTRAVEADRETGNSAPTPTPTATALPTDTPGTTPTATPESSPTPTPTETDALLQVRYEQSTFTPDTLTVTRGSTVLFVNSGDTGVWVASDPHPTHTDYPEFDSKRTVQPGDTYSFTFTEVGRWGYHNHLNSSATGTIVVTEPEVLP